MIDHKYNETNLTNRYQQKLQSQIQQDNNKTIALFKPQLSQTNFSNSKHKDTNNNITLRSKKLSQSRRYIQIERQVLDKMIHQNTKLKNNIHELTQITKKLIKNQDILKEAKLIQKQKQERLRKSLQKREKKLHQKDLIINSLNFQIQKLQIQANSLQNYKNFQLEEKFSLHNTKLQSAELQIQQSNDEFFVSNKPNCINCQKYKQQVYELKLKLLQQSPQQLKKQIYRLQDIQKDHLKIISHQSTKIFKALQSKGQLQQKVHQATQQINQLKPQYKNIEEQNYFILLQKQVQILRYDNQSLVKKIHQIQNQYQILDQIKEQYQQKLTILIPQLQNQLTKYKQKQILYEKDIFELHNQLKHQQIRRNQDNHYYDQAKHQLQTQISQFNQVIIQKNKQIHTLTLNLAYFQQQILNRDQYITKIQSDAKKNDNQMTNLQQKIVNIEDYYVQKLDNLQKQIQQQTKLHNLNQTNQNIIFQLNQNLQCMQLQNKRLRDENQSINLIITNLQQRYINSQKNLSLQANSLKKMQILSEQLQSKTSLNLSQEYLRNSRQQIKSISENQQISFQHIYEQNFNENSQKTIPLTSQQVQCISERTKQEEVIEFQQMFIGEKSRRCELQGQIEGLLFTIQQKQDQLVLYKKNQSNFIYHIRSQEDINQNLLNQISALQENLEYLLNEKNKDINFYQQMTEFIQSQKQKQQNMSQFMYSLQDQNAMYKELQQQFQAFKYQIQEQDTKQQYQQNKQQYQQSKQQYQQNKKQHQQIRHQQIKHQQIRQQYQSNSINQFDELQKEIKQLKKQITFKLDLQQQNQKLKQKIIKLTQVIKKYQLKKDKFAQQQEPFIDELQVIQQKDYNDQNQQCILDNSIDKAVNIQKAKNNIQKAKNNTSFQNQILNKQQQNIINQLKQQLLYYQQVISLHKQKLNETQNQIKTRLLQIFNQLVCQIQRIQKNVQKIQDELNLNAQKLKCIIIFTPNNSSEYQNNDILMSNIKMLQQKIQSNDKAMCQYKNHINKSYLKLMDEILQMEKNQFVSRDKIKIYLQNMQNFVQVDSITQKQTKLVNIQEQNCKQRQNQLLIQSIMTEIRNILIQKKKTYQYQYNRSYFCQNKLQFEQLYSNLKEQLNSSLQQY